MMHLCIVIYYKQTQKTNLMKKITSIVAVLAFATSMFAQDAPKKDAPKKDAPKKEVKKDAPKKKDETKK
jgi:pentapeptide MXKDX repeat protein